MLNGRIIQYFIGNVSSAGYCSEVAPLAERHTGSEEVSDSIPGSEKIFGYWFMQFNLLCQIFLVIIMVENIRDSHFLTNKQNIKYLNLFDDNQQRFTVRKFLKAK